MDIKEIDREEMGQLTSSDKLEKAKKTVRQYDNEYYLKCAKDGSEWKFINYAYIPNGFQCEWCGNTNGPPKHAYFIQNKKTDERKIIGSICIENVMKLGEAYDEFESFKKKINKITQLKNMKRDEFINAVAEASGKKEQIMLEIQDLQEEIEKEKAKRREERRKRVEQKRKEEEKKVKGRIRG